MKVVKGIVIAVASVLAAFFIVALLLPSTQHVERSIVIEAERETVFDLVDSFDRFNEFSPWFERDPEVKTVLSGPDEGVGHTMKWESDKDDVGNGMQEIVEMDPPRMVKSKLDFGFGEPPHATWLLEEVDGGTKVTWTLDSTFQGDYVGRYFGIMLDGMLGPDYERGLAKLKEVAEADQEKKSAAAERAEAPTEALEPAVD